MRVSGKTYSFFNQDRGQSVAGRVSLAGTSRARREGLLAENTLDDGQGLWIVPCEAIHTFGMKIPIDSIFLDKELRVRATRRGLKPRRIAVCLRAHSVLELPAGTIERSATEIGDRFQIL